jgi:hypothetical protein
MIDLMIVAYFFTGLVQDLLITWQTTSVIEKRPALSGILAALNTILAATVWHMLIPDIGLTFWINGISYAIGGGLGVWWTIFYKKKKPYMKG